MPQENVKVTTATKNIASPTTINWSGTTLDFTGATVTGLSGSGVTLKTNGVPNVDQTVLDLLDGTGMTIVDNGDGTVTFNSTSSGVAWGDITGTLSAQIDLQSALDAKASIGLAAGLAIALG